MVESLMNLKLINRSMQLAFIFIISLFAHSTWAQTFRIGTFEHDTTQIDVTYTVMKKVYQRLGHELELVRFPGKRALVEANKGTVDGELIRIKKVEKQLNNLIRIPTSIGRLRVMALTRAGDSEIVGMGGLIGKRIGIVRGVELTDKLTQNQNREIVNSIQSLFKILLTEHVDVILFPELDAKKYLAAHQLEDKITINKAPILDVKLYHYIYKGQQKLASQLTELLAKLEKSGELDAMNYYAEQAGY
jgi:polar amino acid transport system substrate-binding protein